MQKLRWRIFGVLGLILFCHLLASGSFLPFTMDQQLEHSGAAFRGTVESVHSFLENNTVRSRVVLRVEETFKGSLPASIEVIASGGEIDGRGDLSCSSIRLKQGDEALFFVSRGKSGKLQFARGEDSHMPILKGQEPKALRDVRARTKGKPLKGEDCVADAADTSLSSALGDPLLDGPSYGPGSTATNLMVGSDGLGARFLQPDGGGSIPYLIDAQYLPAGLTLSQAVWAVTSALNAWTNVCSAKFSFAGYTNFGMPASMVDASDGVLRIQLHDAYGALAGAGELGEGGHGWTIQNTASGWTTGGNVAGSDFHKVTRGYVMLKHTATDMRNLLTFAEVLGHEVGHALGLGHSSQNYPEPSSLLKDAIMYWLAHSDGRGAALNNWDINVSRQIHPYNTPPTALSRYLDVVTSPMIPLNVPGVNQVRVPAFDLQTATPTLVMANASSGNGTFSLSGSNVTYVPKGYYSDAPRYDPDTGYAYDRAYVRATDGVNASPWAQVAVVSFNEDAYNEGIPNWWRNSWFGSPDPGVGQKHHANDDLDGDGLTNIQEWRMDSNPTQPEPQAVMLTGISSAGIQFKGRAYDGYELLKSTNMVNWVPAGPVAAAGADSNGVVPFKSSAPREFYKLRRIP